MKRFLCCAALVALIGAPAFAGSNTTTSNTQSTEKGEIGFGFGHSDPGLDEVDSAMFLGLRGGYNFNPNFELEGQFGSASDDGTIAGTDYDATFRYLMANGVYNFRPAKQELVPYVMAGIGQASTEAEVGGVTDDDSTMAYQVGGGTRYFFGKNKRTGFRADLSFLKHENFDESTTVTTLTAGLTWKLGNR
jgi:opacity protein-like surface antigen